MEFNLDFPRAYSGPLVTADFRTVDEDFVVTEELGFEPEGSGEHQYLQIVKRGENTQWVAKHIAAFAGVKEMDVGYCGLKDRHAETTQWFSVYLPKRELLDWGQLASFHDLNVEVLRSGYGQKKLRRGQHANNHFVITLRNCVVDDTSKLQELQELLRRITLEGVPNYFGEQRFGRAGNNLTAASRWLDDGMPIHKCGPKAMLMSAARSYLFNLVLAERVRQQSWNKLLEGDSVTGNDEPAGPLWGRGRSATSAEALTLERGAYASIQPWINGLEHCGLHQERRSFVLKPQQLTWCYLEEEAKLTLAFALTPGQFATSVLREFCILNATKGD